LITINCDKCEKPFEIEDDAAGERVECPYCGDINRVPAAGAPVALGKPIASTSTTATKPVGPSSNEPERTIAIVRQAMFRAHPFWYSLMIMVIAGGIVLAVLSKVSQQFTNMPWMVWVGIGMIVVGMLCWLIWWGAPHRWIKLTITNKRTIRQEGIVVRKTSEVLHNHIRNVKIEQSVLERLFGVGSISIDTAGGEGPDEMVEIEMKNVARPYRVKEIIDQYRRM
jgi:membrane protein YdbS with pleckstrin-like domain